VKGKTLGFLFSFIILFLAASAYAYDFRISGYSAYFKVRKDNIVEVHEEIRATFLKPRHGIYRTIPLKGGDRVYDVEVFQDGKEAEFTVRKFGKVLFIRIGSEKRLVTGTVRYDLFYKVFSPFNVDSSPIKVSLNLLGTDWKAPVLSFSFSVNLPAEPVDLKLFCGKRGSRECRKVSYEADGSYIYGESEVPLYPGEGVTLYAYLPYGSIHSPPFGEKLLFYLKKNPLFPVSVFISSVFLLLWFIFGRDRKLPLVVFYKPPEIPPAEAGVIYDDTLNGRDLSAVLLDWSNKGLVEITERKGFFEKDFLIRKLKEIPQSAPDYEKSLFYLIFSRGQAVTLNQLAADKEFLKSLKAIRERIIERVDSYAYAGSSLQISYLLRKLIPFVFLGLFFLGTSRISKDVPGWYLSVFGLVLVFLSYSAFAVEIARKSKKGEELYRRITGFREFFERVEKPVVERILREDPDYPFRYLPYAVALDILDLWLDRFHSFFEMNSPGNFSGSITDFTYSVSKGFSSAASTSSSSTTGGVGGGSVGGGGGGSW